MTKIKGTLGNVIEILVDSSLCIVWVLIEIHQKRIQPN